MPYLGKITEKLKHTLKKKFQINTIHRFPYKLNSIIKLQKDKFKKGNNENLVYLLNCDTCDMNYVEQTKRFLETRKTEHADNIQKDPSVHNVISNHITENSGHDMDWENITFYTRRISGKRDV